MKTYMARQPIFDAKMDVYGYELLYRSGMENRFDPSVDGDTATRQVVSDVVTTFGIHNMLNGKYAFVNFTKNLLLSNFADLLNPKDFVIEILEDVTVNEEVIQRLKKLREDGFLLALDDYVGLPESEPLLPYVNIVKVDWMQVKPEKRAAVSKKLRQRSLVMLAEKIETEDDLTQAQSYGYDLFQGYFFAKPLVFSKTLLSASATTYMRALQELHKPDINFETISNIIRADVTLTYRLLRHINTLQFDHRYPITSVKQAIVRMGVQTIYRWLMLVLVRDITNVQNSNEFSRNALIRGIFCDKICSIAKLPYDEDEAYIVGMFSIIDSVTSQDFQEILEDIAVSQNVMDALLYQKNELSCLLQFASAYEKADWKMVQEFTERYHLQPQQVVEVYESSVREADKMFSTL